ILIRIKTQVVATHPRILCACVLSIPLAPEDIVLHPSHVLDVHAGFQKLLRCSLCFMKDAERSTLFNARLTQHHRPANLRVIAVHLRRQLGRNVVALLKTTLRRRTHSEDFSPARPDQHEIVLCTVRLEKRFYFRNQLVLCHASFGRLGKMTVAGICKPCCLFKEVDLVRGLDSTYCFNCCGRRNRSLVNEPGFHEFPSRDCRFAGYQAANSGREITLPPDGNVQPAGEKLRIPWMGEHNRNLIRARESGHSVRSKEIEVDKRSKEILTPAMSVEKQDVPTGFGHQVQELAASFSIQHGRSVYKEVLESRHQ